MGRTKLESRDVHLGEKINKYIHTHIEVNVIKLRVQVLFGGRMGVVVRMGHMEELLECLKKFCFLIWVVPTKVSALLQFVELHISAVWFYFMIQFL